tara:strand:+ start:37187 stop:37951 length:765 start_codon:yes stop_codon:yes gene_type:complete
MINVRIQSEDDGILASFNTRTQLNQEVWDDKELRREIAERLVEIADEFLKGLGVDLPEHTLTITGSLANYNWSKYSDIDLHIILPFDEIDENDQLLREFFNAKQAVWNSKHDIKLKDHEVEIYVQNESEPHVSTGVYSVTDNEWIMEPEFEEASIDRASVRMKAGTLIKRIQQIEEMFEEGRDQEVFSEAIALKNKIKRMRKCGLEKEGIFSVENISFKVLRRNGSMGKLIDLINDSYDNLMSLTEKNDQDKAN